MTFVFPGLFPPILAFVQTLFTGLLLTCQGGKLSDKHLLISMLDVTI